LSYFRLGVNFNSELADMRGPPVSHRFPRRARLSARRRRVAATRPRHAALHARLKGAIGTMCRRPDSRLPTAPPRVPRSDSTAAVRSRPRVSERADATVYLVRRASEYAALPRSRASRPR
jgi:hypothetical protein